MGNAHVTHAECDGVHVLYYSGRVDYMSAPAIRRFLENLIDRGGVHGLVFDLSEAEALDSTNLGLLAKMRERAERCSSCGSMIVCKNDDIACVLRSMGFEEIFEIVTDSKIPPRRGGAGIDDASPNAEELRDTMLEAHRALMQLSEAGRAQFADVVACLESERAPRSPH